jgi:hypothetical protein
MSDYLVTFNKPYKFEGKEYTELDLSGIENLTTRAMLQADKLYARNGNMPILNEMTSGYAVIIAHTLTNLPIEFFDDLPAKEGVAIRNVVSTYFLAED